MNESGTCLQLDVGNSSAKWRLVNREDILARGHYVASNESTGQALLNCVDSLEHIWISSVASTAQEETLAALLQAQWGVVPWFARTQDRSGSLCNSYADPSRMGVDRWLAMLGARARTPGRLCVIDAGSALTIDIVSNAGQHEGGYIVPGPALMERALLLDTDRVRFEEEVEYALSPGISTAEAVRHGIALAQVGAVCHVLDRAGAEAMTMLYCGGAGEQLMQLVDRGGQWQPDLVFEGLEVMATLR